MSLAASWLRGGHAGWHPRPPERGDADAAMRHSLALAAQTGGLAPAFLHATHAGRPAGERMGDRPVSSHTPFPGEKGSSKDTARESAAYSSAGLASSRNSASMAATSATEATAMIRNTGFQSIAPFVV